MSGRYGERISISSSDVSVPTLANKFRICTSLFYNHGIEHVKITYFIPFNRERQASVSIPLEDFIPRSIPVEPKFVSLNGKLSVRDNQLFRLMENQSVVYSAVNLFRFCTSPVFNFRWI